MQLNATVNTRDFVRAIVALPSGDQELQVDFVCERVPRIGKVVRSQSGDRIDNGENMLANKITAVMSRDEPKDVADLYALSISTQFSWTKALADAESKMSYSREDLHYRLVSFPVELFDTLHFASEQNKLDLRRDLPRLSASSVKSDVRMTGGESVCMMYAKLFPVHSSTENACAEEGSVIDLRLNIYKFARQVISHQ